MCFSLAAVGCASTLAPDRRAVSICSGLCWRESETANHFMKLLGLAAVSSPTLFLRAVHQTRARISLWYECLQTSIRALQTYRERAKRVCSMHGWKGH